MSMDIYAAKIATTAGHTEAVSPVIDFKCWDRKILAPDADARSEAGEDPFISNPDFVENAGMSLSNANADMFFGQIGLPLDSEGACDFDITTVVFAALRALNGAPARYTQESRTEIGSGGATFHSGGIPDGYMVQRLQQLLAIAAVGQGHGATHIVVV